MKILVNHVETKKPNKIKDYLIPLASIYKNKHGRRKHSLRSGISLGGASRHPRGARKET